MAALTKQSKKAMIPALATIAPAAFWPVSRAPAAAASSSAAVLAPNGK